MDGRRHGRLNLRLDAAYCAVAALTVAGAADWWSGPTGTSPVVLSGVAVVVGGWALLLLVLSGSGNLDRWLRVVGSANVVAAVAVTGVALSVPSAALAVLLAAVAVEVAGFAVGQASALRRLRLPVN